MIDGLKIQNGIGYGMLLVEGDLTLGGGFEWNGLILVTGKLEFNGGALGVNINGAVLANQFFNDVNPEAHYQTTGPEIWRQTSGKVTHFVAAAGTGGTVSGSFSTDVRESDDEVIRRATVFCDTREGAPVSSGDLAGPIAAGMLTADDIPDLFDLARGNHPGRTSDDEITAFKSVGASLEDFAAAVLVYEQVT